MVQQVHDGDRVGVFAGAVVADERHAVLVEVEHRQVSALRGDVEPADLLVDRHHVGRGPGRAARGPDWTCGEHKSGTRLDEEKVLHRANA